jgi:glycosyltransferase involved in cell wall biosynthesis
MRLVSPAGTSPAAPGLAGARAPIAVLLDTGPVARGDSTVIDPLSPDYTDTPVSPLRPAFGYTLADMTMSPYVTVVTPFYNTGAIFHDTARTILHQSLQQWEWFIVNDGSTEPESLAILNAYRDKDSRIHVLDHEKNRGLSAARNTGFHAARTAYVVQIDSDDLLEPTALEKWCWCLESYPEYAFVKGYSVGFGAQEYLWRKGFHTSGGFLDENVVNATSMIRKSVHETVGGYDETRRGGFEDWEFWLRCASHGYYGGTIPEYLDWYRRRPTHNDRWTDWDGETRQRIFQEQMRQQYPQLWTQGLPAQSLQPHLPYATLPQEVPCGNRLHKEKPRLLLLVPWLTMGGADKFNLDMLAQLTQRGWEITIATTLRGDTSWLPLFARYTPDIFPLPHFLRLVDYPRFLGYLMQSRQIDVVLVSNSELGYLLLPHIRAQCPDVTLVDFCHMEEEHWKNGGHPRAAVAHQPLLDLNIVASQHLKHWMIQRGADAQRIAPCYINVDVQTWSPDAAQRAEVRRKLAIDAQVPVIIYAARLCAQKQPEVFGQTMHWLAQKAVDFIALVVGDGPEGEALQALIGKHRLQQHVRLLGAVSNERVRACMMAADVFFLPSQWEGIALSIYEAMACGLPIVGADVGGQRELVTPECGILLPRSDVQTEAVQYAAVLTDLLAHPQRRQAMGKAGRARISQHFRLEQMGERMVTLLHEARQAHTTRPQLAPSTGVGWGCAAQAIEYMRLFEGAEALWMEREQARSQQARYQELEAWLQTIQQTVGWRILERARRVRNRLLPQQTWRWRIYKGLQKGFEGFLR